MSGAEQGQRDDGDAVAPAVGPFAHGDDHGVDDLIRQLIAQSPQMVDVIIVRHCCDLHFDRQDATVDSLAYDFVTTYATFSGFVASVASVRPSERARHRQDRQHDRPAGGRTANAVPRAAGLVTGLARRPAVVRLCARQ
ncbi:hypothetical protein GCM10009785_34130 [Brooklawnia cerclae]